MSSSSSWGLPTFKSIFSKPSTAVSSAPASAMSAPRHVEEHDNGVAGISQIFDGNEQISAVNPLTLDMTRSVANAIYGNHDIPLDQNSATLGDQIAWYYSPENPAAVIAKRDLKFKRIVESDSPPLNYSIEPDERESKQKKQQYIKDMITYNFFFDEWNKAHPGYTPPRPEEAEGQERKGQLGLREGRAEATAHNPLARTGRGRHGGRRTKRLGRKNKRSMAKRLKRKRSSRRHK